MHIRTLLLSRGNELSDLSNDTVGRYSSAKSAYLRYTGILHDHVQWLCTIFNAL